MPKRRQEETHISNAWIVTYSDMITLLLTFFVLLLSMSSMDHTLISRIRLASSGVQMMELSGAGKIPTRISLLMEALDDPESILEKKERIKDLLLPDTPLPPEINRADVKNNIEILTNPQGVVIALTDKMVFEEGNYALTPAAQQVLGVISNMLEFSSADVNIAGHTESSSSENNPYLLSSYRALTVLEYFLHKAHKADRFSISAYGPDKPLHPNDSPENKNKNRRVEILLKTTQWLGGYI